MEEDEISKLAEDIAPRPAVVVEEPPEPEAEAPIQEDVVPPPVVRPKRVVFRKLKPKERLVALQFRWHQTYPQDGMPEDMETLEGLIPSGLKRREELRLLHGFLEHAKASFFRVFNQSWTKEDFNRRVKEEALQHVLGVLHPQTRREIEKGLRFLPDS